VRFFDGNRAIVFSINLSVFLSLHSILDVDSQGLLVVVVVRESLLKPSANGDVNGVWRLIDRSACAIELLLTF
jgi:hypothetical protein